MKNTGWLLSDIEINRLAFNYEFVNNEYVKHNHYGFATYPDGTIRTNILEFTRFLQLYMNKGKLKDNQLITEKMIKESLKIQFPDVNKAQALGWTYTAGSFGTLKIWYPGHSGGDPGITTLALYDPQSNNGFVLFTNFSFQELLQGLPLLDIIRRLLWEINLLP